MLCVTATVTKNALRWHSNGSLPLVLLFTQYETTCFTASSHCLAALPAKMSAFISTVGMFIFSKKSHLKQKF